MDHTRTQHSVGQGFFHTGELSIGGAILTYAYDCGSDNRAELAREISTYSRRPRSNRDVDILFVSHLDSDHVNGLDTFLGVVKELTLQLKVVGYHFEV